MSFEEQTESFRGWLLEHAVDISSKVQIADFRASGQGRCVVANAGISSGEDLFSIPRSALLNVDSCSLVKDHSESRSILSNMTQWDALVLVFVYEWKIKAESSPWWTYFNVLPINDKSYASNQLIFWNDAELNSLAPSYVLKRVGHDSAAKMYARLMPHFQKYIGEASQEDFHLVASVIMAYSFDVENVDDEDEDEDSDEDSTDENSVENTHKQVEETEVEIESHHYHNHDHDHDHDHKENNSENEDEDENQEELVKNSNSLKSMVPLADTLNADTKKHNASLFISSDRLVMRSIKPIAKDEQIYNIYAEHPNSEILRRYGYVEQQGSAHDFGEVSLDTFKKYFAENSSLSKDTIDEIVAILETIEEEEEEKFVLDTYDCFATGEVIFELTFLTQLFVIIAAINHKKSFNSASSEVKARAIRRVYKKSYQLLEGRKLTAQFIKDFPKILNVRLSECPRKATRGFPSPKETPLTRSEMATVVLASECLSLQSCMDTEKVFTQGEFKFSIIDDEKLLRNIMKKDTFEGSETQPSKKSRTN